MKWQASLKFLPVLVPMMFSPFAFAAATGPYEPQLQWATNTLHDKGAAGVSIALIVNGQTYFRHQGSSGKESLALTKDTLFEIGSNTKTFTTTLLGIDIARGDKALTDPISKYLPGVPLQPSMQSATLGMLATFTAGLPDDPPAVVKLPLERRGVEFYTVEDFLHFIGTWNPATPLPAPDVYSNSSVGLLGLCLADKRIDLWMQRVRQEILTPLGMTRTVMRDEGENLANTAQGYRVNGTPAPRWPIYAWAPAGALRSTASDLSKYLRAYLHQTPTDTNLSQGMDLASQSRFPMNRPPNTSQACAWVVRQLVVKGRAVSVVVKDGGTAGFSSALVFSRDLGIGVVILTNRANLPAPGIGQALLERVANPALMQTAN